MLMSAVDAIHTTKLYDKNVKDVRQLIDVMKLYSIQKTKTFDEILQFMELQLFVFSIMRYTHYSISWPMST